MEGGRLDSYRVAVTPTLADDGRTAEGKPKSRRKRPASSRSGGIQSQATITEGIEELRQGLEIDEHKIHLETLYQRYETDPHAGLTNMRVKQVADEYGTNKLSTPIRVPEWVIFCKNLFGGFSLLLWIAAVLSLVMFSVQSDMLEEPPYYNLALGILLIFVVLLTGAFSYFQETHALRVSTLLQKPEIQYVSVIRDGRRFQIPSEEVVMGDIVDIRAGDRIPADIRIITAHNFKVDMSMLTGKLEPQARSAEFTHENPFETMNMAYSTTYAVEGSCRGVVVATGDLTLSARMTNMSIEFYYTESNLIKEVSCTVHTLTTLGIFMGLVFFVVAYIVGFHFFDALIFLVGIIIAIVPEGLLAVITICLILTAKRMRSKNCLVKNLECVEPLGGISSVVVDKSGILTQGNLTASHMWLDGGVMEVDNTENQSSGGNIYRLSPSFQLLARVAGLCNSAVFATGQENQSVKLRRVVGDPVDAALLRMVEMSFGSVGDLRQRNKRVCDVPFNGTSLCQITIHENDNPREPAYIVMVKGAPERLLDTCSTVVINGHDIQLDEDLKEAFGMAFVKMANAGETVLAFCELKLPQKTFPPGYPFDAEELNFPTSGYRLLGMISLRDPVRPNVIDAVSKCRSGGIRVVMFTGDHPITAKAIAHSTGLFTEQSVTVDDLAAARDVPVSSVSSSEATAVVIHGPELKDMTVDRLDYLLRTYPDVVVARASALQKLRIVEALQTLGNLVAVTGRTVSDAMALRKADIGISSGLSGTNSAKEAADIILLDDNFSTVVSGIEEGRLLFENLRKAVGYLLTSNMPEVWPFFMFLVIGWPLPLGAITILVIDLGTDLIPAISLSFEKPEHDIMQKRPRNPRVDRLVDIDLIDVCNGRTGMIMAFAGMFTYIVVMGENGFWCDRLFYLRRYWDSLGVNDLKDSYGQEWSFQQRKDLEWTCHSAFFVSIVMCQWVNLIMCKTRNKLLLQQGFDNHVLSFALIFETALVVILLYIPGMREGFRLMPVKFNWWVTSIPFLILIFIMDEMRRFLKLRKKDPHMMKGRLLKF